MIVNFEVLSKKQLPSNIQNAKRKRQKKGSKREEAIILAVGFDIFDVDMFNFMLQFLIKIKGPTSSDRKKEQHTS